jgi:hypothetical protein
MALHKTQLHSLFVLWWIGRGQFDLLVGLANHR